MTARSLAVLGDDRARNIVGLRRTRHLRSSGGTVRCAWCMITEGAHCVCQGELSELSLGLYRIGKVRARLGVLAVEKCVL
jgi:hypothetical protein